MTNEQKALQNLKATYCYLAPQGCQNEKIVEKMMHDFYLDPHNTDRQACRVLIESIYCGLRYNNWLTKPPTNENNDNPSNDTEEGNSGHLQQD